MWIEESSARAKDSAQPDSPVSAKQLERLHVSSGRLLVIDQFMLGNQQFLDQLPKLSGGEDPLSWVERAQAKLSDAAKMFGGCLLPISPGDWGVLRDPDDSLFVIGKLPAESGDVDAHSAAAEGTVYDRDAVVDAKGNSMPIARVFIDTRCLVFVDAEILGNDAVLAQYKDFRKNQNDKAARDLIRENGAAVRYGFGRDGDELGVFKINGGALYALWPDAIDSYDADGNTELPE